jgi:hypothetical protein
MSNHAGSYLLCEVLELLDREQVFDQLGRPKAQRLVADIVRLAQKGYDCNSGEILEGHAERLGLCSCCLSPEEPIQKGLCPRCFDGSYPYAVIPARLLRLIG